MASHLSMDERKRLSTLLEAGFSRAAVSRALVRAKSTITRELARNCRGWWYCPRQAQKRAERRRRQRPLRRKMDHPAIAAQVKRGLRAYHSPDQIAGRMKRTIADPRQRISASAIYRWIRQQKPHTWECYLRCYGRRKRGRKSNPLPRAVDIAGRPVEANERLVVGHWEGDTLVGPRHKGAVVTLVDRKSRYLLMARTKQRAARPVRYKLQKLLGSLAPDQRRSATFDRGHEFAEHVLLTARLQMPVFFAAPYSPWQRGTCENTNGLMRQFFPKGTPLQTLSPRRIANVAQLLNHRPRKILNYLTPCEIFNRKNVAIET
jgi:transposase, IS30 family